MRLPSQLHLLRRALVREDAHTRTWALHVQVGEPRWDWTKPVTGYELKPEAARDRSIAARFRAAMHAWKAVQHRSVLGVFDLNDRLPSAILEHERPPSTLAALLAGLRAARRALPEPLAAWIGSELVAGMRAAHDRGVSHGLWADHILVGDEVKLAPYGWHDAPPGRADDERCAASLCSALTDLAEPVDTVERPTHPADLRRLVLDVCPPAELAWEPALG